MNEPQRNILSLKDGTLLLGSEIKEWISYNIENHTSHYSNAMHMQKYLNIVDDKKYCICKGNYQESERWFHVYKKEEIK